MSAEQAAAENLKPRRRHRNRGGRMTLAQHLREVRRRLFYAALGILAGGVGGFFLGDLAWDALRQPILEIAEEQGRNILINYSDVTSSFDVQLQLWFTIGIVISAPIWLYQIWAFILPALSSKEKLYSLSFFLTAVPLFFAGTVAAWFVLPHIVALLTSFAPIEDANFIGAKSYLDLVLKLTVAVGIAFVVPVALVLLNFLGVLSGKSIIRSWRWAILGVMLFAAAATPAADVVSMFLLAIPMVLLYLLAAGITLLRDRRRQKKQDAFLQDALGEDGAGSSDASGVSV